MFRWGCLSTFNSLVLPVDEEYIRKNQELSAKVGVQVDIFQKLHNQFWVLRTISTGGKKDN